ncbi:MAG: hypothetical protein Ct9H300mP2_1910 [Candidatus Neomarinimicrobiota bacterium]|nr:MAG: hypothetical protein Ct9H300mP2_1910 [Candidatus Neomarinimicrobiota bacterium]
MKKKKGNDITILTGNDMGLEEGTLRGEFPRPGEKI